MRVLPFVLGAAALTGCSSTEYFLVSSRFVANNQAQQAPEVIGSDAYRNDGPKALTVALRAPDSCANNTADQASGGAKSQSTILATNCGVEMAEIEKALARNNYRVISWNVVAREMRDNKSATTVASALGADVLFQINSLEKSQKALGKDARWERMYYKSNREAAQLEPLPLADGQRQLIRQLYLNRYETEVAQKSRTWAVTLDATAVWVKNGQSIWYYRWTKAAEVDNAGKLHSVLLACIDGKFNQCYQTFPYTNTPVRTTLTAGESEAVSVAEKAEDKEKAIYAALLRDVISNFVGSFAEVRTQTASAKAD